MPKHSIGKKKKRLESALRRMWILDSDRLACLKNAQVPYEGTDKRRKGKAWQCALCKDSFTKNRVQVDHIECVGSFPEHWEDLGIYMHRLCCPLDNLRVLCIPCHQGITNIQRSKGWK